MQSLFSLLRRACGILLKKHGEVYYINGSETLPPPLSANEENEITARLSDEPELKSYLIEHNLRLVVYIAKKFENTGIGIEDLISIGTIGLIMLTGTETSFYSLTFFQGMRTASAVISKSVRKGPLLRRQFQIYLQENAQ